MSIDRRPLPMTTLQYAALQFAIKVKNLKHWEALPSLLVHAICGRFMTAASHKSLRELVAGDWIKFEQSLDGYVIDEGSLPSHPERLIGPRAPELGETEVQCLLSHWDAGERALGDSHFTSMSGKASAAPAAKPEPPKPPTPPKPASRPQPATVKSTPAKKEEAPMPTTTDSTEPIKVNPQQYRALSVIQQFTARKLEQRFVTGDLREPFGLANIPILPANAVFQLKSLGLIEIVESPKIGTTGAYIYRPAYGKRYYNGTEPVVELIEPLSILPPKPTEPPAAAPADPPPAPTGDEPRQQSSDSKPPLSPCLPAGKAPSGGGGPEEPVSTASATAAPAEEAPAPVATSDAAPAAESSPATTVVPAPELAVLSQKDKELLTDLQIERTVVVTAITKMEAELAQILSTLAPKTRRLRLLEALGDSYGWTMTCRLGQSGFEDEVATVLTKLHREWTAEISALQAEIAVTNFDEIRYRLDAEQVVLEIIANAMARIENRPPTG